MRWRWAAAFGVMCGCFGGPPGVDGATNDSDDTGTTAATDPASTGGESESGETGSPCDACPDDAECVDETCVPANCGDGIVGASEECDDGPANAQDASCKLDCTLQICGDGERGLEEICDDGNNADGDGCNVDCQESGVVLWEHFHDGQIHGSDRAHDVDVLVDSSRVVIVGAVVDFGTNPEPWIRILDLDGAVEYSTPVQDDNDDAGEMYGVACEGSTGCVAVGTTETTPVAAIVHNAFIQRIGDEGAIGMPIALDKGGADGRVAVGVALPPLGADVVGSTVLAGNSDGVLEEFDSMLMSEGLEPVFLGPSHATVRRIVRDGPNRFAVGWELPSDLASSQGWVFRIGVLGEVAWSVAIENGLFTQATCLARDPNDGSIVVGGNGASTESTLGPGTAVLRRYGSNGGLEWNGDTAFGAEFARIDDVEIASGGDIVAVGSLRIGEGLTALDVLVVRLDSEGNEMWRRVFEDEGVGLGSGVAIHRETGGIIVAGRRTNEGSEDAWVARLTP